MECVRCTMELREGERFCPSCGNEAPAWPGLVLTLAPGVTMEFVRIPAGDFLMGSGEDDKDASSDERPQHQVHLDDYLMGKYPVTVAQFAAFVQATGHRCKASSDVTQKANHPVVSVSWHDAVAFCQWACQVSGRLVRLPTEAEWEKAARGTDGRRYPWGSDWDAARAAAPENAAGAAAPVGSYPAGASPHGVMDMAGNIREWVADWYGETYYAGSPGTNPTGPASGPLRVLRGGSWRGTRLPARAALRNAEAPGVVLHSVGFRCALSP